MIFLLSDDKLRGSGNLQEESNERTDNRRIATRRRRHLCLDWPNPSVPLECAWPVFFLLHTAFEEQYNELFVAVDEISERIRAKGALAPGGLSNLAKMAGIEEIAEDSSAQDMVRHLVSANEKLLQDLKAARDCAGEANDSESEDLMIARVQVHEKTVWMLKSYLE